MSVYRRLLEFALVCLFGLPATCIATLAVLVLFEPPPPQYLQELPPVWNSVPSQNYDAFLEIEGDKHCLIVQTVDGGVRGSGCMPLDHPMIGGAVGMGVGDGTMVYVTATLISKAVAVRIHNYDTSEFREFPIEDRDGVMVVGVRVPVGRIYTEWLDAQGNVLAGR